MASEKPTLPTPEPSDETVLIVLDAASPKGEDVIVRMASLPAWWHDRSPRKWRRRRPPAEPA